MRKLFDRAIEFFKGEPLLLVILVIGFILRIAGIFWGIPLLDPLVGNYHPDEIKIILGAVEFPRHIFTNPFLYYPTFFPYFLAILTLPIRLFFRDLDLTIWNFFYGLPTSNFHIIVTVLGRLFSALAGTGTLLVTYCLARVIYDKKRGLLACLLLSLSLYHAQNSSFATTDVVASFFLVLFLLMVSRAFVRPEKTSLYVLSGIVLGILVGTKYTGAFATLVIPVMYTHSVHFKSQNDNNHFNSWKFHINLLLCGGVALITFLITTPGIILRFNSFIEALNFVMTDLERFSMPRTDPKAWVSVFQTLNIAIGLPLSTLFLLSLFFPFRKSIYEFSYIVFLIAYFIYFGSVLLPRYVILVSPLIALIASNGALSLYQLDGRPFKIFGILVISFVIIHSLGYCLTGAYLRYNDTRTQAAHFIRENVPDGASIGIGYVNDKIYGCKEIPWNSPKPDFSRLIYTDFLDYPEFIVFSNPEFHQIKEALKSDKLSKNFAWDNAYNKEWCRYSPPSPRIFKFYDELFDPKRTKYRLLKTFKKNLYTTIWPHTAEFASPEIRIYIHKH